jgi:diguanylate cyclase (GGDEF)-like protein/PAS domain S-box-containing protein
VENPSAIFGERFAEHLDEAVYVVDEARCIRYWNPAAARMTGYAAEEVLGRRCRDGPICHTDVSGLSMCDESCPLTATLGDGAPREATAFLRHKLGHRVSVELRTAALRAPSGRIVGAVQLFHDGHRRRETQLRLDELRRLAQVDALTGIANRRHFDLVLDAKLRDLETVGVRFALLLADIDRFKAVNDGRGHGVGDRVLRDVAHTLALGLRAQDTVARIGGDEFAVLAPWVGEVEVRQLAERLRGDVARLAIGAAGGVLHPTISLGAALAVPGETREELYARADQALYRAKAAGRDRFELAP